MIISRTPLRISFFGGGTDYPVWYRDNGGSVLVTSIDKYSYIFCRHLPPFFEHKHRIVYSQTELINKLDEICHPAVREALKFMQVGQGIEIHYDGDLPARTGLGSSSSFTVGLLNTLYALKGNMVSKQQLAQDAIHVEQELIKENVGSQDQISTAFGGFNKIDFSDKGFQVTPVIVDSVKMESLREHLMLFYTGVSRFASQVAAEQIKNTPKKKKELSEMHGMVGTAISILNESTDIEEFGKLLHENWMLKRSLSDKVSNLYIDYIYETALGAGARGGKILGAGGGGFILFFVPPEFHEKVKEKLHGLLHVPFNFENTGSCIIYYDEK